MSLTVAKFGGSSLADVGQFRKVKDIILSDPARRYVVPSAPGKRFSDDIKITDMLYHAYDLAAEGEDFSQVFDTIIKRYNDIVSELGLSLDLTDEYDKIKTALMNDAGSDYAASRGEYLNGLILAEYIGYHFMDAGKCVRFMENGRFDLEFTIKKTAEHLSHYERAVIPGFYGRMPNGTIKTFSRGGSDITGSLVARGVNADLYENWTDVNGFLVTDPRIVTDVHPIDVITYKELRELSYMGATVLHEDAVFPVHQAGIPINIRNTNDPSVKGTMIVADSNSEITSNITGIAGKKGFSIINIDKAMMNSELGFGRKVLQILENFGISFEHLPSGIDTMSIVVDSKYVDGRKEEIIKALTDEVLPDHISIEDGLALVAVVGRGMKKIPGTAAKLFSAIAKAGINIRIADQGSSELNIIIGVDESQFEDAIKAIYYSFYNK
ncbi:MAG: aspartate kinase [Acutalibacteraceae bacterium]|nr:aspartate kinase [Acutalibacteraceae bacterium]